MNFFSLQFNFSCKFSLLADLCLRNIAIREISIIANAYPLVLSIIRLLINIEGSHHLRLFLSDTITHLNIGKVRGKLYKIKITLIF